MRRGVVASDPALRQLEYLGNKSAAVATLVIGRIERRRAEGKRRNVMAWLAPCYTDVFNGTHVDQPRNVAESGTVN